MQNELTSAEIPAQAEQRRRLLAEPRFRRFALAKTLQLTGQNALVYGLFIAFITEQSTYIAGSAFVLATVLPAVFLSVPGGLVADRLPNKPVLLGVLLVRGLIIWQFVDADLSLQAVVLLTFLTFAAWQFFTPAENEAVVAVTKPEQTASALSLLQALSLVAQIIGAGVIAPLAIDLMGSDGLFILVILLLATSAVLYFSVPELTPEQPVAAVRLGWWSALPDGYRALRRDASLMRVTVLRVVTDTASLMVLVAAPKFIEDTLDSSPENAIYIGSPAAIGLAVGLVITSPLARLIGPGALTVLGFISFAIVLACLPFIESISGFILDLLPFWRTASSSAGLSEEIAATIVLLPFAGLGMSVVQVASRAAVYREVRPGLIGQVLATQSALGSVAAVVPTFMAGALLDVLPVTVFLTGLAIATVAATVVAYVAAGNLPETQQPPRGRLSSMQH